jgi:glutamine cyclotransferase
MLDMLHIFCMLQMLHVHSKKGEVHVVRQLPLDRRDFGEGLVQKRRMQAFQKWGGIAGGKRYYRIISID